MNEPTNSILIKIYHLSLKPFIHSRLKFNIKTLCCYSVLHVWKQVVIACCKVWAVRPMSENLPPKIPEELLGLISRVRAGIVMKQQNCYVEFFSAFVLNSSM